MKFTPSAKYLRVARSPFKVIERRAYFRKVTSLDVALDAGGWIDASAKISGGFPDATSQIEFDLGIFSADALSLTAKDIRWWDSHIFNAAADEFIECMLTVRIGEDPADMASDTAYYFTGIVDKRTAFPSEADDSYAFTVETADVVADKMFGEFLTTQYYDAVKSGLVLFNIPGVYIVTTNTGTRPITAGVHTITYTFDSGIARVKLDDGDPVEIAIAYDGEITIGNGTEDAAETEQLTLAIKYYELSMTKPERKEDFIIWESPSDLPSTWYTGISLRSMLRTIYANIGIEANALSLGQFTTYDGSRRMSMLEYVADAQEVKGASLAIAKGPDGVLYAANANNVYSVSIATGIVTLLCSVTDGDTVSKLLYNVRNNHLWILHGSVTLNAYGGKISRYDLDDDVLQDPIAVDDARYISLELFDFQHMSGWEYSLLYPKTSDRSIVRIDGVTRSVSVLFTGAALGYTAFMGPEGLNYAYQGTRDEVIYYRFQTKVSGGMAVHEINIDPTASSTWADGGRVIASLAVNYSWGAYDPTSNRVYVYDQSGSFTKIKRYSANDGTNFTDVYSLNENDYLESMYHDGTALYFTTNNDRQVHRIDGSGTDHYQVQAYTMFSPFVTIGSLTYGIDTIGRLFQIGTTIELFLGLCNHSGKTIKNALTDSLRAGNCVGTISAAKRAIVYSRGDSDGNPITSGNSIDISITNAQDIQRGEQYGAAFDIIEIDNGEEKINFDGTDFNVMPSVMSDRKLQIENKLIPTNVIRDYLKMFYEFYKTAHYLYTFPYLLPMLHIEPMDAANVNFNTTKIQVSATNRPIYAVTSSAETGTMSIGVLV